jgi:DNA mismatch endonuclease (patch repair protein)
MQLDQEVNAYYKSKGWIVLRFWDFQVKGDLGSCLKLVLNHLQMGYC